MPNMKSEQVQPSHSIEAQDVKLSICDAYSPSVWVAQTHFWPLKGDLTLDRAFQLLTEGLSRALYEVPAMAGTIRRTSDNPRDLIIEIKADASIEFSKEDLSTATGIPTYQDLVSESFPLDYRLVMAFSQPIALSPVSEGAPMFTAKLNLINGGLALAFAYNHLLTDASSIAVFERLWAKHTRDVNRGAPEQKYRTLSLGTESEIRARLSNPFENATPFEDEHWKIFPATHSQLNLPRAKVTKEAALSTLETAKGSHPAKVPGDHLEETKWCMWYLSADQLAKLKQDASNTQGQWISTIDALTGLFWSRLSIAKQSSSEGHESSMALFPISVRQRFTSPLPDEYIGNAVDIVFTHCPLAELEKEDISGVCAAALRMRKAVSGWSQSQWESWLSMAASLPDDQAICPDPIQLLATRNIGFNDYSKSPAHSLDWGAELGCIDRTRYTKPAASMANCATAVIVNPRLGNGGLEVAVTCNPTIQKTLTEDEMLQRYASLTAVYA